jgi:Na+/proline symporter
MKTMLSFSPTEEAASLFAIFGILGIQWFAQANADGTGYLAQRSMACRSDSEAQKAAVIFTYLQSVLRTLLWLPIVVGLMILYPMAADPSATSEAALSLRESTFVMGVKDHLPTGALGLMLVGLFAALASTVDTHLNWGASYWTNDLYDRLWCQRIRKRQADNKRLVWVARASNIVILVIALAVMTQLGSIQTAWKTSLLLGAGMGIPLLLRWLWHRQNAWGEMVPIVLSFVGAPALLHWLPGDENDGLRLILMTVGSAIASVGASLLTRPVDEERLNTFYLQVRPPGFWGPVAERCGESGGASRAAFNRGMTATFVASASVFGLIVGLGTLVVGAPGPSALPRPVWIALCLLIGLGLIPVWWRIAKQQIDDPDAAP